MGRGRRAGLGLLLARTIGAKATSQLAERGHITLCAHGYTFDVIRDGPIQVLAPRHMVCHLCVVPKERLPWPDSLLLQYLLCRYDPSRLWRSARVLRVRNPRTGQSGHRDQVWRLVSDLAPKFQGVLSHIGPEGMSSARRLEGVTDLNTDQAALLVVEGFCPCSGALNAGHDPGKTRLDREGHCPICQCTWRVEGRA